MVVRRCCCNRWSKACWTTRSLCESRADVASSRSNTLGSLNIARAMATRCFWPPLSWVPLSPHGVLYPSENEEIKSWALAIFAASIACSSVAPSLPFRILSMMDPMNSTGSCETRPICLRSQSTLNRFTSWPSNRTEPTSGS
mmetsp:Transcript_4467/g.10391  ORF Transcript_4467/g.10391 Transcript_4467/m.10391 type:complete len:142 (+) Transcript_4467:2169-2594(+)